MIQNGYHLHFSWRAPVMPGRCAWCDHQARQVWTDGAILAESSPGIPGRPSGLAIAIRTAFIDGCVDRHHLSSLGIHSNLLKSCQASWWAVHEPRSVGSPNLFTNTRSKMLCNCSGVRKRCVMHSKFPAFVQQPLVSYLYPEQVKQAYSRFIVSWVIILVRSLYCACPKSKLVAERILQKGLCLHRAACMLYSFERSTNFFKQRKQTVIWFQIGLFQDSCLYQRSCPMQDQESAKCLTSATSEIFRPSPRYSILGTVFASTASLAFWVDRKVIHQPISPEACGQYQPQVGRGFRKVVIQLQVAR